MTAARVADAVLFDLDGTLADTAPDLIAAAIKLRGELGLDPAPPPGVREVVSRGGPAILRAALPGRSDHDALLPRYLDLYRRNICVQSALFAGMDAVLDGPRAGELPDLIVRFSETELVDAVAHPRGGVVRESRTDLTSAEHGARGFVLARGPRIRPGPVAGGSIVDLAPTILYLTGAEIPVDMDGSVLASLIRPELLDAEPPRRASLDWSNDPWT